MMMTGVDRLNKGFVSDVDLQRHTRVGSWMTGKKLLK